ncbi:hypothetical protein QQF64_034395, partial [Cirrhinus molitorella]
GEPDPGRSRTSQRAGLYDMQDSCCFVIEKSKEWQLDTWSTPLKVGTNMVEYLPWE